MFDGQTNEQLFVEYRRTGNEECFAEVYNRCYDKVCGYVRHRFGEYAKEDIVQSAFLQAIKYKDTYKEEGKFLTWLISIAIGQGTDRWRRKKNRNFHLSQLDPSLNHWCDPAVPDVSSDNLISTETALLVRRGLGLLPRHIRLIFLMRFFEYKTHEQIAMDLDIPLGTVKSRMFRGYVQLKSMTILEKAYG